MSSFDYSVYDRGPRRKFNRMGIRPMPMETAEPEREDKKPSAQGAPAVGGLPDLAAAFSGETIMGIPRTYIFIGAAVGLYFLMKKK